MTDRHGTIEFINHHKFSAHIDVLDADDDEYFIATLAPGQTIRQYSPAGTRWSVRIAHGIGLNGAAYVHVRDNTFAERSTADLGQLRAAGGGDSGWTVEVQYIFTAQARSQTYLISPDGIDEVTDTPVGPAGGPAVFRAGEDDLTR